MAIEIVMPKIGLTMNEGKVIEWRVAQGAQVEAGDVLFVFETEKVTYEVEAEQAGFLAKIIAQVEDVVPVGGVVGVLTDDPNEQIELDIVQTTPSASEGDIVIPSGDGAASDAHKATEAKIRATPMARKKAKKLAILLADVAKIVGTEKRITKADVDRVAELRQSEPATSCDALPSEEKPVALTGMRRIIAEKMLSSTQGAAQTYMTVAADALNLLEMRKRLIPVVMEKVGVKPTITDILMQLITSALQDHPVINSQYTSDGIIYHRAIHMGMAMALDDGLIVPVIREIQNKKLTDIAQTRATLVESGRSGRLTPDEMKGSTFTLSSLGMYGIDEFAGIINQPESAILAVGAIVDKPVAIDGQVVIRPVMNLTLTYDHRAIDGARAAMFLADVRKCIEDPVRIVA